MSASTSETAISRRSSARCLRTTRRSSAPPIRRRRRHRRPVGVSPGTATLLFEHRRRGHPVQRPDIRAATVGPDHERAVGLEHQQADGLRQDGGGAADVGDLTAGDDQAHDRPNVQARPDRPAQAGPRRLARRGRDDDRLGGRGPGVRDDRLGGRGRRAEGGGRGARPGHSTRACGARHRRTHRSSRRETRGCLCRANARLRAVAWDRARAGNRSEENQVDRVLDAHEMVTQRRSYPIRQSYPINPGYRRTGP